MRDRKKKGKRLPVVKKSVKDFLLSEEGKISSREVVKIGLALAMTGLLPGSRALAQEYYIHSNGFHQDGTGGHYSHTAHGQHSNHSNHSSY